MQKFAGLVLDIYDDHDGHTLRSIFPQQEQVPEVIKTAHALSPDERQKLPDDSFALVLMNDGEVLRKFACTDEGNTCLSVEYFLKTGHKLPAEAQKLAAENLVNALEWFELEPPEQLSKVALGLTALTAALTVPGAAKETKKNLQASKGTGGQVLTPDQLKARRMQMGFA